MPKNHIISGLDIGTGSIKLLVAQKTSSSDLESLSLFKEPAVGVRRGVVIDIDGVSNILERVLGKVREETGERIDGVYINFGGSHIFCTPSHGTVAVSRADQKISEEDIERVLEAAKAFSLPSNKEILDVFPQSFILDGERVKEALGMEGVRLEAEVLVVCGFSPYFKNLTQAVLNAGFSLQDIIPSPIAAARACLSPRQKELGVALLDIGTGTSGLAVFEEGNLIHLAILPIGSANITYDIAIGLKTDIDVAENIKKEYGSCISNKKERREKIKITEPETLIFTRKMLTGIIEARASEIFREMNKELKKISRESLLPAGIVLTGGGAKLPKIVELAKKELKLPCGIGKPQGFLNLEKDPSFSTVCGLVLEGVDLEAGRDLSVFGRMNLGSRIKKIFRIFIP